MEKTIIIGGGLLGKELHKNLKKQNIDSQIIKNVNYKKNNNIPKSAKTLIITSQSSDYRNPTFTKDLLYVNTILPMQIIKEAHEKNVEKIIYCSTGSVYKSKLKAHKETDRISIKNISPYISSKYTAEILIKTWENYFKSITVLRPFFIYGSSQNKQMLFSKILDSIINKKEITLGNNKGLIFNPIHVYDASKFILSLMNNTKKFQIFNVCGNENITLHDVTTEMGKIMKIKPKLKNIKKKEDVVLGSIKKMKSINFEHKISIKSGLNEMIKGKFLN